MGAVISIAFVVLMFGCYLGCYWYRLRILLWKWRVIPIQEQMERQRQGLCIKCGYDLRGTPERCPECGTMVDEVGEEVVP